MTKTSTVGAVAFQGSSRLASRALWMPIILLEAYLILTVFVFFFGPIDWMVSNTALLVLFLLVNYGGLWFGYAWGIRRNRAEIVKQGIGKIGAVKVGAGVVKLACWSAAFCIFSTLVRLVSIRGDIGTVLATFLNPGEAYKEAQILAQMDRDGTPMVGIVGMSWAFRISTLFSCLNGLFFPLGLICWRYMRMVHKILFGIAILCSIVYTMGVGAQSGIANLLFSALPVALHRLYVRPLSFGVLLSKMKRAKWQWLSSVGLRVAVAAGLIALFATVMYFQIDRAESSGRTAEVSDAVFGSFGNNVNHRFLPFADDRMNFGFVMACLYMSHGYKGLSLAMELPFEWTYGLGWSKGLQVICSEYFNGPDVFRWSYLARNEDITGWKGLVWWSTIFPWIASDTTFVGTVMVMILIGFLIGRCWANLIVTGNPIAFAVLAQMFILVFMFPANNAIAQTLAGVFNLAGVIMVYMISRRHFTSRADGVNADCFVRANSDIGPKSPRD